MGGIFSKPKMPALPAPVPAPSTESVAEAESLEDQKKKLNKGKGRSANILTSPLGLTQTNNQSSSRVLQ